MMQQKLKLNVCDHHVGNVNAINQELSIPASDKKVF